MPYPLTAETCHFLGDIQHTDYLTPFCRRCGRKGRYSLAGLIERYGAKYPILLWKSELHHDCPLPRVNHVAQCQVLIDELLRRFQGMGPRSLEEEPL